jgi:hypothetical protein
MDWEPAPGAALSNGGWTTRPPGWSPDNEDDVVETPRKSEWDTFAVGKQRMFPRRQGNDETGLESLLAGWGIGTGGQTAKPPASTTTPFQDKAVRPGHREGEIVISLNVKRVARVSFCAFGLIRLLGSLAVLYRIISRRSNGTVDGASIPFPTLLMGLTFVEAALNGIALMVQVQSNDQDQRSRIPLTFGVLIFRVLFTIVMMLMDDGTGGSGWGAVQSWTVWGMMDFVCAY